jgi:hypothetical protein
MGKNDQGKTRTRKPYVRPSTLRKNVLEIILSLPPGEYTVCGMTDEVLRGSGGHLRPTPELIREILPDLEQSGRAERNGNNWKLLRAVGNGSSAS